MKLARGESKGSVPTARVNWELDKQVVDVILKMESHTKISVNELVNTALKRFIASHKDYLPEDSTT